MARQNIAVVKPARTSFIVTGPEPDGTTALGGTGYARDTKSELYLLGVSMFAGESTHHEGKSERLDRLRALVGQATAEDADWTSRFLRWLRTQGQIRTASMIGAVELGMARVDVEDSHSRRERGLGRTTLDAVLQRFDETTEVIAYCLATYGRIPRFVEKAVADATRRLANERSLLKHDSPGRAVRIADVLSLTHPKPKADWQSSVFKHALDRRHGTTTSLPPGVPVLRYRRELMELPVPARRKWLLDAAEHGSVDVQLRAAGMTWESLAGWLQGPMDAAAWEAVIPVMGYMGLLRNLRNFDDAGVSDAVARHVIDRLSDPDQVLASRQFPFRFLAAYQETPSLRWAWPLEQALQLSIGLVPQLTGNTLILVDRSGSMWHHTLSEHSTVAWADAAALFGTTLALRAEYADLVEFSDTSHRVGFKRGESALKVIGRFGRGGGTDIPAAVRGHLRPGFHTRVVILTDEQTKPGMLPYWDGSWVKRYQSIDSLVPHDVPVYVWNFGGYEKGAMPSGTTNRHCFGGLTDSGFELIQLLENGSNGHWPF